MGAYTTLVFEALKRMPAATFRSELVANGIMMKGLAGDVADICSCLIILRKPLHHDPVSSWLTTKALLISTKRFGLLKLDE